MQPAGAFFEISHDAAYEKDDGGDNGLRLGNDRHIAEFACAINAGGAEEAASTVTVKCDLSQLIAAQPGAAVAKIDSPVADAGCALPVPDLQNFGIGPYDT